MSPSNVFQLELATALASRRTLALRVGVALLLALPFILVAMPPRVKAVGLTMLVLFVCFFGSAVGLVRRRTEGQWRRLWLLPIPRWQVWLDTLLASAALDLVQTAPAMIVYVAVNGQALTAAEVLAAAVLWLVAVFSLNALGALLAAAVRRNAEVHLAAATALVIWLVAGWMYFAILGLARVVSDVGM